MSCSRTARKPEEAGRKERRLPPLLLDASYAGPSVYVGLAHGRMLDASCLIDPPVTCSASGCIYLDRGTVPPVRHSYGIMPTWGVLRQTRAMNQHQ